MSKPFNKPALSYEDQAKLLESRGLVVDDHAVLVQRLRAVGYYRLCGYWHSFKDAKNTDSRFIPNTRFADVWERYRFDRQLRLAVIDAIERVEVAVRTALVHDLAMRGGPYAHVETKYFRAAATRPDMRDGTVKHTEFLIDLREKAQKSAELFVKHFENNYDRFPDLPIWAACEMMTFGSMFTLFNMSEAQTQKSIARQFHTTAPIMLSWLQTLNYVRNICAHHARLWNRELAIRPVIPDASNDPRWHGPRAVSDKKIFVVLTLLNQLLKDAAPQTRWRQRLFDLFDRFPAIPLKMMGIPQDWRTHDLWQ